MPPLTKHERGVSHTADRTVPTASSSPGVPELPEHVAAVIPADIDAHLVVDNYATHKHPKVRAWLAARPRFHVHYTPTYSSWPNQIERWFAILTERQIRRSSAVSARDLVAKIEAFVAAYNAKARPFVWTATSDAILKKLERLCKAICGTGH